MTKNGVFLMKNPCISWKMLFLSVLLLLSTLVLLALILGITGAAGEEEEDCRVYGRVFDNKTKEPAEEVELQFRNSGEQVNHTYSREGGSYEMNLSQGNYTLWIFSNKYQLARLYLYVEKENEKELDIYLEPPSFNIRSETGETSLTGEPGERFDFALRVSNTGFTREKFEISCTNKNELADKGFSVVIVPTITMDIDPLKYSVVTVSIFLPKKEHTESYVLKLQARPKLHRDSLERANLTLTVNVVEDEGIPGFLLPAPLLALGAVAVWRKRMWCGKMVSGWGIRSSDT